MFFFLMSFSVPRVRYDTALCCPVRQTVYSVTNYGYCTVQYSTVQYTFEVYDMYEVELYKVQRWNNSSSTVVTLHQATLRSTFFGYCEFYSRHRRSVY